MTLVFSGFLPSHFVQITALCGSLGEIGFILCGIQRLD